MTEFRVNAEQWNAVSVDERKTIMAELRASGVLKEDDQVVPDSEVEAVTGETALVPLTNPLSFWDDLKKGACKMACDATAAAALAACGAKTAGAGLAVCVAVVEAARRECKKVCGG